MQMNVYHCWKIVDPTIPQNGQSVEGTEAEIGQLIMSISKNYDVAIVSSKDPRTRKEKKSGVLYEKIPHIIIDELGGRFKQR